MAAHNHGTKHYSLSDADRSAPREGHPLGRPRFPSATIDGVLLQQVRAEAERRGITISAALAEAFEGWLEASRAK